MAKKSKTTEKPKYQCGQCKYATEDRKHINRSVDGYYFCIRCPYYTDGKFVRLKTDIACSMFKLKTDNI